MKRKGILDVRFFVALPLYLNDCFTGSFMIMSTSDNLSSAEELAQRIFNMDPQDLGVQKNCLPVRLVDGVFEQPHEFFLVLGPSPSIWFDCQLFSPVRGGYFKNLKAQDYNLNLHFYYSNVILMRGVLYYGDKGWTMESKNLFIPITNNENI